MKLLIVVIACLAIASAKITEEMMETLREYTAQCVEQEGITKEQAFALRTGNYDDPDPKVKCYANCMMEKMGLMVDGQFKPDVALEKLGPVDGVDATKAMLVKCGSIKGSDKCDTAYQHFQCFHKNHSEL
ncbi:general odorant-binding protein 56d-like [Drosophila sulfurigaster albostrigata]|uniref:general odorant-binding protein 56d-like n=1 Tax=Drosophila sulfurigaster albostrigata TaxID=89887 RepID=UPI002D21B72E|nr:general odorant-binding protein 56d-like [Drosophila sulfurigaster albostrigata]